MDSNPTIIFGQYCEILGSFSHSFFGWFWTAAVYLWPWYWLGIIASLTAWTFIELRFGIGTSENGFSPAYNRMVGSGVYMLFQWLTHLLLVAVFGELIYCSPWSLLVHYLVFFLTGGFLHLVRFWPYWKIPFIGKMRLH